MANCKFTKFICVKRIQWSISLFFVLFSLNGTPLSSGFKLQDLIPPRVKCYHLFGCYSCAPPFGGILFYRFLCNLPADTLNVTFRLYKRPNLNEISYLHLGYKKLTPNDTIIQSPIIPGAPVKVIIPGFTAQLTSDSIFLKIKDELLKYGNYNVIICDWTSANSYPYEQAFANARVIGGVLGYLLEYIRGNKGIEYDDMHLIGHSLGAHIAGWAGERLEGELGRITGLDPAGVYFQKAPSSVRLDETDAKFVDVIHTRGGHNIIQGYGIHQPIGDVDFYPNGGKRQPKCGKATSLKSFFTTGECDHTISQDYFRTSIRVCKFEAVLCQNYKDFTSGRCNYNNSEINEMGFHAKKIISKKTDHPKYYLFTTGTFPYCNADNSPVLKDHNPTQDSIIYFFVNFFSLPITYSRKVSDFMSYYVVEWWVVFLNVMNLII